jgi:hypothetical protein
MPWNWEQAGCPAFTWDAQILVPLESQFLLQSGEFVGAFRHVRSDDQMCKKASKALKATCLRKIH